MYAFITTALRKWKPEPFLVHWWIVHVCFVQVTIWNIVYRSWRRSRSLMRALSYWYLISDARRCEINRKVRAPRRVSMSGVPHIVTWIKQTWIKRQWTIKGDRLLIANFSHGKTSTFFSMTFKDFLLVGKKKMLAGNCMHVIKSKKSYQGHRCGK